MSQSSSHLVVPVSLGIQPGNAAEAAHALDQLLKVLGPQIERDGKTISLAVFATPEEARKAICKEGDRYNLSPSADFENTDSFVWVATSSMSDPIQPTVLLREVFQSPEFVEPLLQACESPAAADLLTAFNDLVNTSPTETSAFRNVLVDLALREVKDNMCDELKSLPFTERMDLSDRGDYIKAPFDVDPVATLLTDFDALSNAVHEQNCDFIGTNEDQAITEAMKTWHSSASEDLMPVMNVLDVSEDDAANRLEEWCRESTSYSGVVDFNLSGDCAITAHPALGKESIYITFDSISSSAMDAVVDDNYLAMLDLLRIDVRSWVDHLAARAGLEKPNWDINLKQLIDERLTNARHDPATGYHWEGQETYQDLRSTLLHAIFSPPSEEISQAEIDTAAAARVAYRQAVKEDVPEATQDALKQALDDAVAATRLSEEDGRLPSAKYLFDIALQVIQADADLLDQEWLAAHGVDLDKLGAISSSAEQRKTFPQLAQSPAYFMATANLSENGSVDYDWKNPPNKTPVQGSLIAFDRLCSILDNANYSGNLVIAFSCDLDDLSKIGVAAQDGQLKEVRVDGAYLHIHDYANGAGDGEPLQDTWVFTTEDLKEKRIVLKNDSVNSYAIQGVFGEFLADSCSVVICDPKPLLDKQKEPSAAPALN